MSLHQRQALDAMLRGSPLAKTDDIHELRRLFTEIMSAQPPPPDLSVTPATLGSVPTVEITVAGVEPRHLLLYFHGGVYAMGSAALGPDLPAQIGRRIDASVISVEYRLAPEHPFPAAVEDAVAAYDAVLQSGVEPQDIVLAGESAGGGLAVAALLGARDRGLPMPAAALLMSPWADLTLTGASMGTKEGIDPQLSRHQFLPRAADYVGDRDPASGPISPIFADLSGLPPLVIQAGSNEVLLDDAVRLAGRAAADDVPVTLDITPGVPHVFQGYHALLDEGTVALDRAGRLLREQLGGGQCAAHRQGEPDITETSDWNAKTIAEFRANEGRVGGPFEGAPMVLVHHRGRTSAREYVTPMMCLPHDTDHNIIYVFATKGGVPTNPDWYYNLTAAGEGSVERGTETYKVTVRDLTGIDRDRVYAEQARRYPGFAEYERQVTGIRTIPVLELTRV
jgi:monoterpene epsilon-lactone hydrolase